MPAFAFRQLGRTPATFRSRAIIVVKDASRFNHVAPVLARAIGRLAWQLTRPSVVRRLIRGDLVSRLAVASNLSFVRRCVSDALFDTVRYGRYARFCVSAR